MHYRDFHPLLTLLLSARDSTAYLIVYIMETIENMVIQLKWSAIWSEISYALFEDRTSV